MFNNCKEEIGVGVVGMNITLFCPGKTIHWADAAVQVGFIV